MSEFTGKRIHNPHLRYDALLLSLAQRNPITEANAYRDYVPEDLPDELSMAKGEIAWLREAIRRLSTLPSRICEKQIAVPDCDTDHGINIGLQIAADLIEGCLSKGDA